MPANSLHLIAACLAMVLLVAAVGVLLLVTRVRESIGKRLDPQAMSTSVKAAANFENLQPADNFRNLFEVPVLFYALAAIALATTHVPEWLVICSWIYVALRVLHSLIHCTYNRVYHRTTVFMVSFALLVAMWIAFFLSLTQGSAA